MRDFKGLYVKYNFEEINIEDKSIIYFFSTFDLIVDNTCFKKEKKENILPDARVGWYVW